MTARRIGWWLAAALALGAAAGCGAAAGAGVKTGAPADKAGAAAQSAVPAAKPNPAAAKPEGDPDIDLDELDDRRLAAVEKEFADAGFRTLYYEYDMDTEAARTIAKEMIPGLAKDLPWPAPGFRYALTDLDGDGGPELFLILKHWTVCTPGCPLRIYRFEDGVWKLLIVKNDVETAIRPPRRKGEKPKVAFIDTGSADPDKPGAMLPVQVEIYRLDGDRMVLERKIVGRPPEPGRPGGG